MIKLKKKEKKNLAIRSFSCSPVAHFLHDNRIKYTLIDTSRFVIFMVDVNIGVQSIMHAS